MRTFFLDGTFFRATDRLLVPYTPGVFKAKGVFETMLGLDGLVLDAELHLRRLRKGLKILGIKPPAIKPALLKEVLCRSHLACVRLRLMVWQENNKTRLMAMALPYHIPLKVSYRVCLIETYHRASRRFCDVKSLDYKMFAKAFTWARAKGYDEALLLNVKGEIFEASRSNIFWIKDSILYTPPLSSGCLNGITRRQVIQQARLLKITVKEKDLTPAILKSADAAFLTNSLTGIKPIEITSIKNTRIKKLD